MNNIIALVARILLAQIFIIAGFGKLGDGYAATQSYMDAMGVPGAVLPMVILLELGGGIALLIGFLTRFSAIALAAFCIATAILFHTEFDDQIQTIMFMKNLTMTGGLLMLYLYGPGAFSLDAKCDWLKCLLRKKQ